MSHLPFEHFIDDLSAWPSYSANIEAVTSVKNDTFNSDGLSQSGITTLDYHTDAQSLGQSSATVDPPLPGLLSDQSTTNDWAKVSMPEAMSGLNTAMVGGIDEFAHGDLQGFLGYPAPNFDFTNTVDPNQLHHEALNSFAPTQATKVTPFKEQDTALPLPLRQHQSSGSTNTNVPSPYRCATCGLGFESRLSSHSSAEHHAWACHILSCDSTFQTQSEIPVHVRRVHSELRACNQCKSVFSDFTSLGRHASETGHASFFCQEEGCEKAYSRFDVFQRHQDTHRTNVHRFPCQHCRRHRGASGFKRWDHLTQHLRNYHHIGVDDVFGNSRSCPHENCPEWRPEDTWGDRHAFQKSSDYIAHMRKVHKESEFPCTEPGCNRTGPKGYFRMRDLRKHKLKEHGIPIE